MVQIKLLKGNVNKCHLFANTDQEVSLNVDNFTIKNSECEKPLGVKFDSKLTFNQHISNLCNGNSRKVNALARITSSMNLPKRRLLMNYFFKAQFNYCPLIWMCRSRGNNRKINPLHERWLRIIYNNKQLSFKELLEKERSVSIHVRNLQVLATEMCKVSNALSKSMMKNIFPINKNPYTLRRSSQFSRRLPEIVYHGAKMISNLGPIMWDLVPNSLKEIDGL